MPSTRRREIQSLRLPFVLAFLAALFATSHGTRFPLFAFAPFFAFLLLRRSFFSVMWCALFCGLIIDLLCSETRFGLHALFYPLSLLLLYPQKNHFFEEKLFSFGLLTFLISSTTSFFILVGSKAFGLPIKLSLSTILCEVFVMPLYDVFYTFVWFVIPMRVYTFIKKLFSRTQMSRRWRY